MQNQCRHCQDIQENLYHAKEYVKEIINQLYSHRDLDRFRLEENLDKLCQSLGIELCPGDLMIERFEEVFYV